MNIPEAPVEIYQIHNIFISILIILLFFRGFQGNCSRGIVAWPFGGSHPGIRKA
jgi:hypothetical protein